MELKHQTLSNIIKRHSLLDIGDPVQIEKINKKYRKLSHESNLKVLHHFSNCEWMKKHGKGEFIDFNSNERAKMRSIFKELDKDGSGTLALDELYEPLLALGLVETKEEVKEMMAKVDTNHSGLIEFDEFMKIIKSTGESSTLIKFFKNLTQDRVFTQIQNLSFQYLLSKRRREIMMQTYIGKNNESKEQGKRIMTAYAQELKEREEKITKIQKLKLKKEIDMRRLIERKNGIKLNIEDLKSQQKTFITTISRPQTASKRPMTRKEVLNL